MNKNEFLAFSLPYGLKVYVKYYNHRPDNSELETMIGIVDDRIITDMYEEDMAPLFVSNYGLCLHPLSDLTKEIEHKGERFVPIERIKAIRNIVTTNSSFISDFKQAVRDRTISADLWLMLISWHFNIAGLIEEGEAIDVNTLPENPY